MRFLGLAAALALLAGCVATEEDIERWKGTERGPAKIAAVIVDSRYSLDMRGRAAAALVEIAGWEHFQAAFERMGNEDRAQVIHAMVPRLTEMYRSAVPAGGQAELTDAQFDAQVKAKDAMYDVYDWATEADKALMNEVLIDWVVSDFNGHFLPGRRTSGLIVEKVGPPAATALARILTPENDYAAHKIAPLIRDFGDAESKRLASEQLTKVARASGDEVRLEVLAAMGAVCGEPARQFVLEFAARHEGEVQSQVDALNLVFLPQGRELPGCGQPDDAERVFAIAEDEAQDERIRAAAYDLLRATGKREQVPRFLRLIDDRDARYKATGLEIALHVGGAPAVIDALQKVGAARERWPWRYEDPRTRQEYGFCNMGLGEMEEMEGIHEVLVGALSHESPYVRAGAANMLGVIGTEADVAAVERLRSDRARLNGWEPGTVGAQAAQAIAAIREPNRPGDPSARRRRACGL